MPYYKDIDGQFRVARLGTFRGDTALSLRSMTGFRSRPLNSHSTIVTDTKADPYAYFLSSSRQREFRASANARNMDLSANPDRGHTLDSWKYTFDFVPADFSILNYKGELSSSGSQCVVTPNLPLSFRDAGPFTGSVTQAGTPIGSDLLPNFGQRAIAKTAPKLAAFSLSAFLGELMEGLPRIIPKILTIKDRASLLRSAGSDYLNVVFGWKPLLDDLQEIGGILLNATEVLSGRPVEGAPIHRKWNVPKFKDTYSVNNLGAAGVSSGGNGSGYHNTHPISEALHALIPPGGSITSSTLPVSGRGHVSKVLTREQWFEGSYVTFYPLGYKQPETYLEKLGVLLDTRITPSVLWELAPWSWLIDWVTQIGDSVAANQVASDKTAQILYAYAMETTTMTTYSSFNVDRPDNGRAGYTDARYFLGGKFFSTVATTVRKRRIRANPYGFTSGGLSGLKPDQIAILGALGLTKL